MESKTSQTRVMFYQFFPGGGIGRYTNELATAFHRSGEVAVEVACCPEYAYRDTACYDVYPGLAPISHPVPILRKSRFLLAQVTSPRAALSRAEDRNVDVIHFSNINHLTYRFWRERVRRGPFKVAATVHDVRRKKAILNRHWEERGLKQFYRDADALFVHSQVQVEDLIEFASPDPSRIHLVPMGPFAYAESTGDDASLRRDFGVPSDRMVGLCFGMVRDDKNVGELLAGLARLKDERPYIVIAGKMPASGSCSEEALRSKLAALGLQQDVLLLNRFINDDEVGGLYRLANFACLTYKTYFTSQSGVLNVAMHFDCPVLATPAPTLAETVSDYNVGSLCPGDSAADIELGLQSLVTSLKRGERFDFAEYREAHSWQENMRRTLGVYRQLLTGSD